MAKDVARVANKAGLQQARNGALIGGGVSLIRNMVACINGSIEPAEAARNVGVDAGLAAAFGYVTAFSGAAIKGAMQNASSEYLRSLSRTNVAATMVSTVTDVSKVVALYCRGEITGAVCIERLGQQGMGQLGGVMGVAVAMAAVPADGAFMAAMVGMAGSTWDMLQLLPYMRNYPLLCMTMSWRKRSVFVWNANVRKRWSSSANIGVICLGMSRIIWRLMMNCLIEHSMQWIKR